MRNFFLFFLLITCFTTYTSLAQTPQEKLAILKLQLNKDSAWIFRPKKVFPLLALDQRNSFLKTQRNTNTPVNIWGIKGGVTLFDRHNTGLGIYNIKNSSKRIQQKNNQEINTDLAFNYFTLFYEYSFIDTRWFEFGIPIEAGYGTYKTITTNTTTNQLLRTSNGSAYPIGSALDFYFKPVRWFALNIMGGYRYVINTDSKLNLSNWFYSIGLAVYVRPIIRDTRYYFKKEKYKEEVEKIKKNTKEQVF